jgi:hypothetical protein
MKILPAKLNKSLKLRIKSKMVKTKLKFLYVRQIEKLIKNRTFIAVDVGFCRASFFTDDGYVHERGDKNCPRQ